MLEEWLDQLIRKGNIYNDSCICFLTKALYSKQRRLRLTKGSKIVVDQSAAASKGPLLSKH